MKKKIISILLAIVLCLGMVSTAFAANEQQVESESKLKQFSRELIEDMMPYLMNVEFTTKSI